MVNQEFMKLDHFDWTNLIHWKDKVMFLLTALKISYILDPNLPKIPIPAPEDSDQLKIGRKKQNGDELLCRGHIFNKMSDYLYGLFTSKKFSNEI